MKLSIEYDRPPEVIIGTKDPFFDEIYEGELPKRATDPEIPTWINSLGTNVKINEDGRFSLRLQFGGNKVNIGDIVTGKVKSTIDCLYPLIGGKRGDPEDYKIDFLQVEKNVKDINESAVRISVWNV